MTPAEQPVASLNDTLRSVHHLTYDRVPVGEQATALCGFRGRRKDAHEVLHLPGCPMCYSEWEKRR